jgi:hypothetical protein
VGTGLDVLGSDVSTGITPGAESDMDVDVSLAPANQVWASGWLGGCLGSWVDHPTALTSGPRT